MDFKEVEVSSKTALAVRQKFPANQLGDKFGEFYGKIEKYMEENNSLPTGPPFGIYHSFSAKSVELEAGYPSDLAPPDNSEIHQMKTYGGKAVMTVFKGHYDGLKNAWKEFADTFDNAGYKYTAPCFEVYITDPSKETDPGKWITELYTPIN